MNARLRTTLTAVVLVSLALLPGCASSRYEASGDPILDLRNPDLNERARMDAADSAWTEVSGGALNRRETRRAMEDLARSTATPLAIRERLVQILMSDRTEEGVADSKRIAAVMLPQEDERRIVAILAQAAGERGWGELTTSLVRSYAARVEDVEDEIRTERAALDALHPGETIEGIVFEVFTDPAAPPSGWDAQRWRDGARSDAWELLSRLDPSGRLRSSLILRVRGQDPQLPADARELVEDIRRCLQDLACIPRTSMELQWLRSLLHDQDLDRRARNAAWWNEAREGVARLEGEQLNGLELRHAEAIRWALRHRPTWLESSRARLLAELDARLDGRTTHRRTRDLRVKRSGRDYRLADWADTLDWADLVTLLVVDEAVHDEIVIERAFLYAGADRDDGKAAYGGTLESGDVGDASQSEYPWRLILFRPRARDRKSDKTFVVSEDMLRYSDLALAHFRLNASTNRQGQSAGPGDDDVDQAARSGRTTLILTLLSADSMNVDCLAPDGSSIDLGEIRR